MSGPLLAVLDPFDRSGIADPGSPDITRIPLAEGAAPADVADLLQRSDAVFVCFESLASTSELEACLALASLHPYAALAIDASKLARRHRRALRTEGLRFLDPTGMCPIVVRREVAVACLHMPEMTAMGPDWRWALYRLAAARGRLGIEEKGKRRLMPLHLAAVTTDALDRFAGAQSSGPAERRILVIGRVEASTSLYLDGLPPSSRALLRFHEAETQIASPESLACADAAIITRDLERCHDTGILRRLRALDIPTLYFLDDNPMALAAEDRHWRFYTPDRLRKLLAPFAGIIASTRPLADALTDLHPRVACFGPVLDTSEITPVSTQPGSRLAITGGSFRRSNLEAEIMPAIRRLAAEKTGVVLAAPTDFGAVGDGTLTVVPVPRIPSFAQFLKAWRERQPDVLLHPRSTTGNAAYKTPNAMLVALYLGAVPVVHRDEPAYQDTGETDGVLKAADEAGWYEAMRRATEPGERQALHAALGRACARLFDGARQAGMLETLATECPPLSDEDVQRRMTILRSLRIADPAPLRLAKKFGRRVANRIFA